MRQYRHTAHETGYLEGLKAFQSFVREHGRLIDYSDFEHVEALAIKKSEGRNDAKSDVERVLDKVFAALEGEITASDICLAIEKLIKARR